MWHMGLPRISDRRMEAWWSQVIPDEAVEAAARVLALTMYHTGFEGMDAFTQGFLRDTARMALEAAKKATK